MLEAEYSPWPFELSAGYSMPLLAEYVAVEYMADSAEETSDG